MIRKLRSWAPVRRGQGLPAFPERIGVMDDAVGFDPALAGVWTVGGVARYEPGLEDEVRAYLLETKAVEGRAADVTDLRPIFRPVFGRVSGL